jgi:hypothetical protein
MSTKTKKKPPTQKAGPTHQSIEPIVVVFGSERLLSLWCRRNARNPRAVHLATRGGVIFRGIPDDRIVHVIRFPEEYWEPATHPCGVRVREVEDALKRIKKSGGTVIEYKET